MAKPGTQRHATIEALKDRIARDPLSRAFLQLAEEYRKEGRFQEAIDACLDGLQRHPTYHTARISLGRTYSEAGDVENARRSFAEVLELQPENHLAAKLLAEIQKKTGDMIGAAATYRAILQHYPNDREVAILLDEALRTGAAPAPGPSAATAVLPTLREPPVTGRRAAPPAPPIAKTPATPGPFVGPAPVSPMTSAAAAPTTASPEAPGAGRGTMAAVRSPAPPVPLSASAPGGTKHLADPSPDFRAEDFGGASFPPARDSWSPPADAAPGAWAAPPFRADEGGPGDDALQTNTLAELYLRQGLVDRAIEVYRGMLRVDAGNQKAARRLNELAPGSVPPPVSNNASASAGTRAERAASLLPRATPPGSIAAAPAVLPRTMAAAYEAPVREDGAVVRETIQRLERWLASVGGAAAKRAPLR